MNTMPQDGIVIFAKRECETCQMIEPVMGQLARLLPQLLDVSTSALTTQAEQALKPGDTFKECASCPEMIVVPAGEFVMGSPATESGRYHNEGPQHKVTIARPFAVGRSRSWATSGTPVLRMVSA